MKERILIGARPLSPCASSAPSSGKLAARILGPGRSTRIPKRRPESAATEVRWWRIRGDVERALAVPAPESQGYGHTLWLVERARAALGAQQDKVAIEADTQLHEALELFEKYPTLELLLKAAADWNEEQMNILAAEADKEEEEVSNWPSPG